MIVRPDFYVYGGCSLDQTLEDLVGDLLDDLAAAGVALKRRDEAVGQQRSKADEARTV